MHKSHAHTLTRRLARRLSLLCAALLLSVSFTHAQTPAPTPADVQVIPQPRRLKLTNESFRLTREVRLALADARSVEDRFAAEDFANDVRETAGGLALPIGRRRDRRTILIGATHLAPVEAALKRAGLSVPPDFNEEGYVLSVNADEVVVAGKTAAGTFYGLQTLKQLVRGDAPAAYISGVQIIDWPQMRWRGLSDDISRGPVPTVEYIKRQLRTLAYFKMNMHSFYMEHTFGSRAHPLIAPAGGSLTPEEIKELVVYARRYHIELVPEQQTFGHLHKALKFEKYNELAETPHGDLLSPQQEGSFKLVADWYKEIDALFPSKFFHIGADETFELGEGQSREQVKARGVGAVYFEHLRRVREILQPYNRRLMFWGDIALNHPELIGSIPKDLIVMNWAYGARENFAARIKPFKDAGLEQFVCPGVSNWNQVFPNLDTAVRNITGFVREGQRAGVLGMLNTNWDDDGETLFEMAWYGVVLGAAASWQEGELDVQQFERNYDWAFFRRDGQQFVRALRTLGGVNTTLGISTSNVVFWQEPFTNAFQERARGMREKTREMRLAVEGVEELLAREGASVRRNRPAVASMRFAAQRLDHMGRRMQVVEQFSRDYWQAYLNLGDRRQAGRLRRYHGAIYNNLREMAEELAALKVAYREQWLAENRPYWLDSVLARYDQAIATWLARSKAMEEAMREYNESSTLPNPEEFGLGSRPEQPNE
ncbi:MAG TPA: glycoside hydrolase family 20 zincin-like fold domain-containing protein [Pyrinomonadaceae bacterium]|nr:glycoside hydrolase family 20 zincin-like fold domain-containing protein [Pyrinomonadaceae bacterium]